MRKLVLSLLASGLIINSGSAQTLFTYGATPVTKQEFLRNYQKNALNKKPDFSETALREYLDLYSLFRMKVREAESRNLDTMANIQRELDSYRKQLAKTYLTDEEVTNKMLHEAYDRMKEERHVAHILLMAPPGLNADDTLRIYKRIDSMYNAVTKNKADFSALARQFSEDRGTKDNGGDLGFMTALQTLYPFETAVYSTAPGKVSAPFRTALGYHIVKVIEKRPARGQVQVAHILVTTPESKGKEGLEMARRRIDSVVAALKAGASFDDLVAKYSEDRYSTNENGVLPAFGVGRMVPAFEDAAFALKKPGDISGPVQTKYGYHVIKLISKEPLKPYDSIHNQLKRQVDNDSRAQMAREIYFNKIKAQNGFKEYPANLEELAERLSKIPDTGKNANEFKSADYADMNKPVFSLGTTNYTQRDMVAFAEMLTRGRLTGPKKTMTADIYKMYVERVVNDFQENRLVEENEDFRNLMQEYRDGIMLFELMDQNVWSKASRDTTGLKAFYEANKAKYQWEPGFSGSVYRFKDETALADGLRALNAGTEASDDDVLKAVNTEGRMDGVTVQNGRFEFSRFTDIPKAQLIKGRTTSPVKNSDGTFTVVKVTEVYNTNTPKSLEDARGYVVAEYQDYLEKKWNDQLRQKYPLKVEDAVLRAMIKK